MSDIFKGVGVEITLENEDAFLKVRETLTRIGVSSRKEKVLYQSCHILHKQGRYVILHFKELFSLDGLPSNITEEDLKRRNAIISLLEEWDLLDIVDKEKIKDKMPLNAIKIIKHEEKANWQLIPKFNPGSLRKFFNS